MSEVYCGDSRFSLDICSFIPGDASMSLDPSDTELSLGAP